MPNPQQAITLAILAGGEGTRMGRPKGELVIDGQPILRYLLRRFTWPGPTMLVTAPGREHPPACEDFDLEVSDARPGEGPLRGIFTALEGATTPLVVVTTVDMPGVERQHFDWLASELVSRPKTSGVMLYRAGDPPRIEPFPSAFRRDTAVVLARRLHERRLSVQALSDMPEFTLLAAPINWDESTWLNLNYPQDLAAFMRNGPTPA